MGRIVVSIGKDCRGDSLIGYAVACMMIVMLGMFASRAAGSYLSAGLTRALSQGVRMVASSGGCQGGDCPVRVVASPIGYPGLGALNPGGHPAFLVAASPSGG